VVNERDGLGDGLVPDYLTHLQDGGFYGWPYSYLGQHPQPRLADRRPDLVKRTIVPDLLFRSHSAPLGLAFYTGTQFPQEYRGDAFVALHGSWNSATPPATWWCGAIPGRATGGLLRDLRQRLLDRRRHQSRGLGPAGGLAIAKDGSLLIADDVGNTVWRVSYTGSDCGDWEFDALSRRPLWSIISP